MGKKERKGKRKVQPLSLEHIFQSYRLMDMEIRHLLCTSILPMMLLVACSSASTLPPQPHPSIAPMTTLQIATPQAMPTGMPTKIIPNTPTPITATCQSPVDVSLIGAFDPSEELYRFPVPKAETINWVSEENKGFTFQPVGVVTPIDFSSDGRWMLATRLISLKSVAYNVTWEKSLEMFSTESNQHWQVAPAQSHEVPFLWLSNQQLLWLVDGTIWMANQDGRNKQNLKTPEPIQNLLSYGKDQVIAWGKHLWRFDVRNVRWDRVLWITDVQDFHLSSDGTYGMAVVPSHVEWSENIFFIPQTEGAVCQSEVWRIPLEHGKTPLRYTQSSYTYHCWTGDEGFAPFQVGYSPYWQTPARKPGGPLPGFYYLDERDGRLSPVEKVFSEPEVEPFAYEDILSPDHTKLVVSQRFVYDANTLKRIVEVPVSTDSRIVGWLSNDVLAYARNEKSILILTVFSLSSGEQREIARIPGGEVKAYNDYGLVIRSANGRENAIQVLDNLGNILVRRVLTEDSFGGPNIDLIGERIFVSGITGEVIGSTCQYHTYVQRWDILSPKDTP